jgi:uncharacterized protein (DUF1778 family)
MSGPTRAQFILETAVREAENTLLDQRAFVLGKGRWAAFEAALDTPVDTARLDDLLASRAPWQT